MSQRLVIGRVLSSHGVRGEIKVQSLSGEDAHFKALTRVWLKQAGREWEMKVASVRGALPNLIVALDGISSPEDARKFRGADVLVERSQASRRKEGEYYFADLVGCELLFQGSVMATVTAVWENSNCYMLESRLIDRNDDTSEKGAETVQIPFQDHFIGNVDTDRKQIELLVDWILE